MVKRQTVRLEDIWLVAVLMCCRFRLDSAGMDLNSMMYFNMVFDRDIDKYIKKYKSDQLFVKAKKLIDTYKKLQQAAMLKG